MKSKPVRYLDIARDYALWREYCDRNDTEEQFNSMTVREKMNILTSLLGIEEAEACDCKTVPPNPNVVPMAYPKGRWT